MCFQDERKRSLGVPCHGYGMCLSKSFTFCNSKSSMKVMKLAFNKKRRKKKRSVLNYMNYILQNPPLSP